MLRVLYVAGIALDRKDFDLSLSNTSQDFSALKLFRVLRYALSLPSHFNASEESLAISSSLTVISL